MSTVVEIKSNKNLLINIRDVYKYKIKKKLEIDNYSTSKFYEKSTE